MKKLIALVFLFALSAQAQLITRNQLTNYAVAMLNGTATNPTVRGPNPTLNFVSTDNSGVNSITDYIGDNQGQPFSWTWQTASNSKALFALPYVVVEYFRDGNVALGRTGAVTTNNGDLRVKGTAFDANGFQYVTTQQASNNVRVSAGLGVVVTATTLGGGVQNYEVASTGGLGATNAIGIILTNNSLLGSLLNSMEFTNGTDIIISGSSNNSAALIQFTLNPLVRSDLTNYIDTRAVNLSNWVSLSFGTLGTNTTNHINLFSVALSNYVAALGTAVTNGIIAQGAANTNYTINASNGIITRLNLFSVALTNFTASKQDGATVLTELVNSGIRFPAGGLESNVNQILYSVQTVRVPTNSAISNLVVNVRTNKYFVTMTNNITLTNFTGIQDGIGADTTIMVLPQLINRGVGWPTFGAPSYGIYARTNSNTPMWTTLTQGIAYAISISAFGTNTFWAITEWK